MAHTIQVTIACDDPSALAAFWAAALDYILQPPPEGHDSWDSFADEMDIPVERRNDISAAVDPEGLGPRILFERWDGGSPNQRVHMDVNSIGPSDDEQARSEEFARERARLERLGARFDKMSTGMAGEHWMEMYDPEGNWFCVQ